MYTYIRLKGVGLIPQTTFCRLYTLFWVTSVLHGVTHDVTSKIGAKGSLIYRNIPWDVFQSVFYPIRLYTYTHNITNIHT